MFDIFSNNADRKGGHVILDTENHLWAIDHGICFHVDYKLRTVIWDFAGMPIAANLVGDMCRLFDLLNQPEATLTQALYKLLSKGEVKALRNRLKDLIDCMEEDDISTTEKVETLRSELAKHHQNDLFLKCGNMGSLLKLQLKSTLAKHIRKVRNI